MSLHTIDTDSTVSTDSVNALLTYAALYWLLDPDCHCVV